MASQRSLMKDFYKLLKSIDSFTDGQARVLSWTDGSDEDEFSFQVEISPSGGLYCGGKYTFKIATKKEYWPTYPPKVTCQTLIFHPNIGIDDILDPEDSLETLGDIDLHVCIGILEDEEWSSAPYSFDDCVQALLFLLYEPNIDDALSQYLQDLDCNEMARLSVKGGEIDIDGRIYVPMNVGWRETCGEITDVVACDVVACDVVACEEPMETDIQSKMECSFVKSKRDTKKGNQVVMENFFSNYMHEIVYEDPGVQTFEFYQ